MATPADHLEAELKVEEGVRTLLYDDATGKPFKKGDTLKGNLSAGAGINLMVPFDAGELAYLEKNRINKAWAALKAYAWFAPLDEVRQVALADLTYNLGLNGLLHWPHFLSFMAKKDYPSAVAEIRGDTLWCSQVGPKRANRIETMILSGQWPSDISVIEGVSA